MSGHGQGGNGTIRPFNFAVISGATLGAAAGVYFLFESGYHCNSAGHLTSAGFNVYCSGSLFLVIPVNTLIYVLTMDFGIITI